MPVLHSYLERSGVYIRTSINGHSVTFQVTHAGEQVLKNMGYKDESAVSWNVISPLYKRGAIYTNKTGVDETDIDHRTDNDFSSLNPTQQDQLQKYIRNCDAPVDVVSELKITIKELLDLDLIALAERHMDDMKFSEGFLKSVKDFKEVPFDIESVKTPIIDDIRYDIKIDDVQIECIDNRWVDNAQYDFQVKIQEPDKYMETIQIHNGYLTDLFVDGKHEVCV